MLSDDGEGLKATQSLAHTKARTQRAERFYRYKVIMKNKNKKVLDQYAFSLFLNELQQKDPKAIRILQSVVVRRFIK